LASFFAFLIRRDPSYESGALIRRGASDGPRTYLHLLRRGGRGCVGERSGRYGRIVALASYPEARSRGGRAVQLTEVSVLGVRSSVTVFRHRSTALRFVLIPTIHFGRPEYYRRIAERLARCQLVVAEQYDGPSSTGLAYGTALRLSLQRRGGPLVRQDIDYQALGVSTVWPDGELLPGRHRRLPLWGWLDLVVMVPFLTVAMAVGGRHWLLRRNLEVSDDSEPRMRSSFLHRVVLEERDELLVAAITRIHQERNGQAIDVAIVYGAAHMPAVVQTLAGRLGYRPERGGEWLVAIDF
jgi:hypothetical protein